MSYIGIDIGGTKCAVVKGNIKEGVTDKISFATKSKDMTIKEILKAVESLMPCDAIGVSCGGPLDEELGVILSPPNLPGWDDVHITEILEARFGVPARLRNDANACALAEWKFGAGRGSKNMVFLTFGTGLGAGIIADGRLYSGANGNAGEIGHIRLSEHGPIGYGKEGSFEGFCSGGGITRLAEILAKQAIEKGESLSYAKDEAAVDLINTKMLAELAKSGDSDARAVFDISAKNLGRGLAIIVDVLNPEVIVIGSVYARSQELFYESMQDALAGEALSQSLAACRILPAELGDSIGDIAALCVAMEGEDLSCEDSVSRLVHRYPELAPLSEKITAAIDVIENCYRNGGKVLLCGNGGSAADCEHISGELLKGFMKKRTPTGTELDNLSAALGSREMAQKLQCGVPAIPLTSLTASLSAFANDVDPELVYSQLTYALGKTGDVLICLSTSGNSKNVLSAAKTANALGIKTVALTGKSGGGLMNVCDVTINAPATETYKVQELHLPIYHAICAELEDRIFK